MHRCNFLPQNCSGDAELSVLYTSESFFLTEKGDIIKRKREYTEGGYDMLLQSKENRIRLSLPTPFHDDKVNPLKTSCTSAHKEVMQIILPQKKPVEIDLMFEDPGFTLTEKSNTRLKGHPFITFYAHYFLNNPSNKQRKTPQEWKDKPNIS